MCSRLNEQLDHLEMHTSSVVGIILTNTILQQIDQSINRSIDAHTHEMYDVNRIDQVSLQEQQLESRPT